MHFSVAAALLSCTAVLAFYDSSPFVLFSTSKLPSISSDAQLQTSKQVLNTAARALESCPTERDLPDAPALPSRCC
ncbi:hypothetical protein P8C59_006136 [Phyllachora maydis]|uniref:Secreted protein n=1 Tax=Phyllachora maydis TaxID=1825666 RepID=A0AAD9MCY4_9PEZI|nr:hypothetical protein P8C59_006136 [Phyllachora maydis]